MEKFPLRIKRQLFEEILKEVEPFGDPGGTDGLLPFLMKIWPLYQMPSEDYRFDNAYEDVVQHTINNYDWTDEYLFVERLKLFDDNRYFQKWIEALVSPGIRKDEDEINRFVYIIAPFLEKGGYQLVLEQYDEEDLPIFQVKKFDSSRNLSAGIPQNEIPFFVVKNLDGRADRLASHSPPEERPAFILAYNNGWNDYQIWSSFEVFFYGRDTNPFPIGLVKIAFEGETHTASHIPEEFKMLDSGFYSLGQTENYYNNLKIAVSSERQFKSVLFALKDTAFFPQILEKYENDRPFKDSLIRFDGPERLVRQAKYSVFGYDLTNLYQFNYIFTPKYSEGSLSVEFPFHNKRDSFDRILAFIGKNGTGKTQLITSLPQDIAKENFNAFDAKVPIFSKVIAVSYSIFDKFEIPKKSASFNYVYCGLRNETGEQYSDSGLVNRFHFTWKRIRTLERINQWREILLTFIEEEVVDEFIVPIPVEDRPFSENHFSVAVEDFKKVRKQLSSGQAMILYVLSEIVANIRLDSLLLFDEPETHLHPNAITQLMNTIYKLVHDFESYCVIATHSPLIVRELLSRNVFVVERVGNTPSIRKIGIESFGANLTTLTEEVFGNREIPKQHRRIIADLILGRGLSFEEICNLLETDGIPLSYGVQLHIQSLIQTRDEES